MARSYTARLAALYAALFGVSVTALGMVTLFATHAALEAQFEARIRAESRAMVQEYKTEGLTGITEAIHERDLMPGELDYGLTGPGGLKAGRLVGASSQPGWTVLRLPVRADGVEALRVFTTDLPDGLQLKVGDNMERTQALDRVVLRVFAMAFVAILVLGAVGGYGLSRGIRGRVAAITGTAEAIIDGDLSRRVAIDGDQDDLGSLALTFNRMLDRIAALMESVRHVSSDIAHDLRTPLTRLRNRLEAGLTSPASARTELLEAALADLDAILMTFAALLRIAQIESGARRTGFREVDLTVIASDVAEAFSPSAEEGGRRLILEAAGAVMIEGDGELLTQMLVNLVENALRHTGPNAAITVKVARAGRAASLSVADNGPGVPDAERERLFDRFYRLERSRATPGSGLGLALVAAVAKLHGAEVSLAAAQPGLEVRVSFPEAA